MVKKKTGKKKRSNTPVRVERIKNVSLALFNNKTRSGKPYQTYQLKRGFYSKKLGRWCNGYAVEMDGTSLKRAGQLIDKMLKEDDEDKKK